MLQEEEMKYDFIIQMALFHPKRRVNEDETTFQPPQPNRLIILEPGINKFQHSLGTLRTESGNWRLCTDLLCTSAVEHHWFPMPTTSA